MKDILFYFDKRNALILIFVFSRLRYASHHISLISSHQFNFSFSFQADEEERRARERVYKKKILQEVSTSSNKRRGEREGEKSKKKGRRRIGGGRERERSRSRSGSFHWSFMARTCWPDPSPLAALVLIRSLTARTNTGTREHGAGSMPVQRSSRGLAVPLATAMAERGPARAFFRRVSPPSGWKIGWKRGWASVLWGGWREWTNYYGVDCVNKWLNG